MAVIRVAEKWESRSSSVDGDFNYSLTRQFLAETNNKLDDAWVVGSASPVKIGDLHPSTALASCNNIQVTSDSANPQLWTITVTYTSPDNEDDENNDPEEVPTSYPATITWANEQFDEIVEEAEAIERDDLGAITSQTPDAAVQNSAGDPFDPPVQRDVSRWSIEIKKNMAVVPTWILEYADAINDADWNVDGITVLKHFAKINSLSISEVQIHEVDSGVGDGSVTRTEYRTVTFGVLIGKTEWYKKPLDAGFRRLITVPDSASVPVWDTDTTYDYGVFVMSGGMWRSLANSNSGNDPSASPSFWAQVPGPDSGGVYPTETQVQILNADGQEPTAPVPLDGSGQPLQKDGDPVFQEYWVYDEKDFSVLPVT